MAVDDMGHGNSSPLEKCPVFSESVEEVEELLNALEIEKIVPHGARVKQGQVIVWFKTETLDKKISKAQTDLTLARLTLDEAEIDEFANLS